MNREGAYVSCAKMLITMREHWPKHTLQETADGFTTTLTFDMSVLLIYICIFKYRTIH